VELSAGRKQYVAEDWTVAHTKTNNLCYYYTLYVLIKHSPFRKEA